MLRVLEYMWEGLREVSLFSPKKRVPKGQSQLITSTAPEGRVQDQRVGARPPFGSVQPQGKMWVQVASREVLLRYCSGEGQKLSVRCSQTIEQFVCRSYGISILGGIQNLIKTSKMSSKLALLCIIVLAEGHLRFQNQYFKIILSIGVEKFHSFQYDMNFLLLLTVSTCILSFFFLRHGRSADRMGT